LNDVKTSLEFIQTTTGVEKLVYVGHSQGTSEGFVLLTDPSTHEWANNLISHYVGLAPICLMTHFRQKMILILSKHKQEVEELFKLLKIWKFAGTNCKYSAEKREWWNLQCAVDQKSCYHVYTFMDQFPEMDDLSRTGIYLNTRPQSLSVKSMIHYAQLISKPTDKPEFAMFDYGPEENFKVYGQLTAPVWDLGNIKTKMTFLVGTGDYFSTVQDVTNLKDRLVNAKQVEMKVIDKYGHTTMVLGVENYELMTDLVNELKSESQLN